MSFAPRSLRFLIVFTTMCLVGSATFAQLPRVYPEGQQPDDSRLQPQKDLNGFFPFQVPESQGEWQQRREELRRRVLVATGLWPLPEKTPLNAVIHGKVERDGFTVEKVYFESVPGHFVTGLLFRPVGKLGRRAAVLCPHGHGGRLQDYGADKIKQLVADGQEKFEASGRYPKLARCAHLARMGCVTFIFDMLGYTDSQQISFELAHRFSRQRPDFDTLESWGLFSTQAELRLQSIMGVQTWNSIRCLDFLCELPDVDPERIAVTGGSGGGTQTILLCGIDDRPVAAFPQGMVSSSMQGGCTCENCSLLRIGTGNVELAGLFAPKPQAMTTANDWTKEMMVKGKGFPELQQLYELLGAKDNVECKPYLHFPHNYNAVTRADMYVWFNRHLKLGFDKPPVETDYKPLSKKEYTVWNEQHPKPKGGDEYEREFLQQLDAASNRQIAKLIPTDSSSLDRYRYVVGGAMQTLIGRRIPDSQDVQRKKYEKLTRAGFLLFEDTLRLTTHNEELPIISLYPKSTKWNGQVVIWIDGHGKSGMFNDAGQLRGEIRRLVDGGYSVVGADLLYQGEFRSGGQPLLETPKVKNPREFAGFTFGYNDTVFASRVHDILTLVAWVRGDEHSANKLHVLGVNGGGPLVAAARAISGDKIDRAAIDTQGFRFTSLQSFRDPNFLPGITRYGDLPGMLALSAPHSLWVGGEGDELPAVTRAAFNASGQPGNLVSGGPRLDVSTAAVDGLLSN
jgi:cephalosporin-C deacetylase-like acetyl esterase